MHKKTPEAQQKNTHIGPLSAEREREMNSRSIRTKFLSSLSIAVMALGAVFAQNAFAIESITSVTTDKSQYLQGDTMVITVNANFTANNDDWYRTGIEIRQGATVVDSFCSEMSEPDLVNGSGPQTTDIDYDTSSFPLPSGAYQVWAHGFKPPNSVCDPSNVSNGFQEGFVASEYVMIRKPASRKYLT